MKSVTIDELGQRMNSPEGAVVLDVRADDAYREWRIQGAGVISLNIQNSKLKQHGVEFFPDIPRDKEIITVCAKGNAAQETVDILEQAGYTTKYLLGGMEAWSEYYEPRTVTETEDLAIYQMVRPAKGCLSYIVASDGQALVIDAGRHIERYEEFAREKGLSIKDVVDTHLHADHVSGGRQLATAVGADYWIAPEETEGAEFSYRSLTVGHTFEVGKARIIVQSLRTPGHTPGSTSFQVGNYLLTGDTLFVSGLGRSDLKGHAREMAELMFGTVRSTLSELPGHLMILPGHFSDTAEMNDQGYIGASLEDIRKENPMLHIEDKDTFVNMAVGNVGVTPPNHEAVIAINRGQRHASTEELSLLEIGPNRCAVKHA